MKVFFPKFEHIKIIYQRMDNILYASMTQGSMLFEEDSGFSETIAKQKIKGLWESC